MAEIVCLKCGKVCKSLQGWKMHMTSGHGGYDDQDIAEATGTTAPSQTDARARMNAFADSLSTGDPKAELPNAAEIPATPEPEQVKRIKATPKKFKKLVGDIPAKILEMQGVQLDSDDEDVLDEAADFLTSIFGVEFAVPESKTVVQSRFLAVLWVAGITLLVLIKHKMPELWKMMQQDDKAGEASKKGPKLVE